MKRLLVFCAAMFFLSSDAPRGLESINQEIEILTTQLSQLRMKAFQEDIHGQRYMLEESGKFASYTQKSEKFTRAAHQIEKKLRELTTQRDLLLNQQTSSPKSF